MSTARKTPTRWRLASIAIRRFRGVADEQTYVFDGRSGMLHGDNGVGKSTVAVALQWILYGRFPGGVLQNITLDRFLVPVGQRPKSYSGEVVFWRGDDALVFRRDGDGTLELQVGGETFEGDEAVKKRDALLGLDMDTFVRAVLLQQSRIRALLLEEPKERNKAIDRLLGMDVIEHLIEIVRPKDFEKAAAERRWEIEREKREHEAKEKLLAEQLENARATARNLSFLNKDMNPTGLEARYADIGRELQALGRKYHVAFEKLPQCGEAKAVPAAQRAFAKGVRAIRLDSELKKRSGPVDTRIALLTSLRERWHTALKERDDAKARLTMLVGKHGEVKVLAEERSGAETTMQEVKRQLKAADSLRELLGDARKLVDATKAKECPVCEQVLARPLDLPTRLRERVEKLASEEMRRLRSRLEKAQARIVIIDEALEALNAAASGFERTQKALDTLRNDVVEALDGAGVAENKVARRLDEELARDESELAKLKGALDEMEEELERLTLREGAIREGLVPVVQKRDEISAHQVAFKKLKAKHATGEAAAASIERLSASLDAIKKALLEAKREIATELLDKASPRAQELYKQLVKQPVFDTLNVRANAKAGKVDYEFAVRKGDASATARDARLVLSDGQLTATALALFFGLAESTAHELDLLCVDDPTQNLDLRAKEAMAKVITEVALRRQVIIATQDEDFVSFLKTEGFPNNAVVHHISAWNGSPTVETDVPR